MIRYIDYSDRASADFEDQINQRTLERLHSGRLAFSQMPTVSCNFESTCDYYMVENFVGKRSPKWIGEFYAKLREMKTIKNQWNDSETEPPNSTAIRNATEIIDILNEMQLMPVSIAPSAEEGVTISFVMKNNYAAIESYNDGDLLIACTDENGIKLIREFRAYTEEIRENLKTLSVFLNA